MIDSSTDAHRCIVISWELVVELKSIYKCVIGLDVHQAQITVCVISEDEDGNVSIVHRQFGAFKRNLRELAQWCASFAADEVVMERMQIWNDFISARN